MRQVTLALAVLAFSAASTRAQESVPRCFTNETGLALEVNLETAALRLCRDGVLEARYPIVIPLRSRWLIEHKGLRVNPIRANVRAVWRNPVWRPTPNIRATYARRGIFFPEAVKPYSINKGNPLGVGFIVLEFPDHRLSNSVGIHGTNKPALVIAGKADSFDCIRTCNLHWLRDIGPSVERELAAGREVAVFFIAVKDHFDETVRRTAMEDCREPPSLTERAMR